MPGTLQSWQLTITQHGEPLDVIQERTVDVAPPIGKQVRVNFRAAPVNPSDLLTAQGAYGILPKLPGVMGHKGAGYVSLRVTFFHLISHRLWTVDLK